MGKRKRSFKEHKAQVQAEFSHNPASSKPATADGDGEVAWGSGIVRESPKFEKYYKEQNIIPEGEWETFMTCLKTGLPLSFRISTTSRFSEHTRQMMGEKWCGFLAELEIEGEKLKPPQQIPWYPNQNGWQLPLSRKDLRKATQFKAFHNWLMTETDSGTITRQEAVSMLPPLFLDVQPEHKVLDMCAAPGSKTSQLCEMLQRDGPEPLGFVLANDVDDARCFMLSHQLKRLRCPCVGVVNHEAQNFPFLNMVSSTGGTERMYFDRILCDVPCSGDGTMRKAPDLWRRWDVQLGRSLHKLQIKIAMRGVRCLNTNGLMVYSTCSLNPIEDEAVVCEMLRQANGSLELVDVSDKLPELKRSPGLDTWKVRDRDPAETLYENYESVPEWIRRKPGRILPTFFPPTPEIAASYNLHRCMRILPHHQDTGGFFIAVLRKTSWGQFNVRHPLDPEDSISDDEDDDDVEPEDSTKIPIGASIVVIDAALQGADIFTLPIKNDALNMIQLRTEAREHGRLRAADKIRRKLRKLGVAVSDTSEGSVYELIKKTARGEGKSTSSAALTTEQSTATQPQDTPTATAATAVTEPAKPETTEATSTATKAPTKETTTTTPTETTTTTPPTETTTATTTTNEGKKRKRGNKRKEGRNEIFDMLKSDDVVLSQLRETYQWQDSFNGCQLFKGSSSYSKLSYVTHALATLITSNDPAKLRLCNMGLKMFQFYSKHQRDVKYTYRLCQEAADILLPHLPDSVLMNLSQSNFEQLIRKDELVLEPKAGEEEDRKEIREFFKSNEHIPGYFLCVLNPDPSSILASGKGSAISVVCRSGKGFIKVMVNQQERLNLASKLASVASGIDFYIQQLANANLEKEMKKTKTNTDSDTDADDDVVADDDDVEVGAGKASEPNAVAAASSSEDDASSKKQKVLLGEE